MQKIFQKNKIEFSDIYRKKRRSHSVIRAVGDGYS